MGDDDFFRQGRGGNAWFLTSSEVKTKKQQQLPGTPRPTIYKWLAINWMMNPIFT